MRRFLFALALIVCSVPALAKDRVEILSEPSWLVPVKIDPARNPDLKNVSNGYFFELYDNQINIITHTSYTHFIRNIINESGVQNGSEISVDFVPAFQNVIFHKVQIIRNNVVINQLNRKDIKVIQEEAASGEFQYNGNKRAFIILKDVRKGDKIEASYSITGTNPIFGGKCSIDIDFCIYSPVTNIFQTIIAEDSRKLNFTYFLDAPRPTEEVKGNTRVYHWSNAKNYLYKSQSGAPSWHYAYPYITITDFNNWQEVAEWGLKLMNNYKFELPAALLEKIRLWKTSANGSKDEFARLALRYVQDDIRYLGIEEGIHTHKPHDPKVVFHQGYGDCKDKSLLLSTILRYDSITAYVALVNTSRKEQLSKSAANPREFDHAIVAIARKGTFKFVDPTRSMQKGSLEDTYVPPYSFALILREKETDLWTMSIDGRNSTNITETYKFSFNDTTTLQVSTKYAGSYADNTRSYFSEYSENDIKEKYINYYSPVYKDIKMDGDLVYNDDSSTNTVTIKERYLIPSAWSVDEKKKKSVTIYAKAINDELAEPSEEGEMYPIELKFPCEVQYTMKLNMPEDWSFPDDGIHILNSDYQFDYSVFVDGDKITLNYYYKTFKDHIPVENLSEYREDYKKIKETVEYSLTYTPGENNFVDNSNRNGKVHWPSFLIFSVTGALMTFLLIKLNKKSIEVDYDRSTGWPIGGWMVVLGISLGLGMLVHFYELFFSGYFQGYTWEILQAKNNGLVITGYSELFFDVVKFSASIAVFVWFIRRRDIFPRMFVFYIGTSVTMQILLLMMYNTIDVPDELKYVRTDALRSVIQLMIYAAIWCTYVIRSDRAKATFLESQ